MSRDDVLFKLLRIGLNTTNAEDEFSGFGSTLNDVLPIADYSFSVKQGVGAFVFDGLQKAIDDNLIPSDSVSKEIKMKLFSHTNQVERVHKKHEIVIKNLANFYANYGIKIMVLKGVGLSSLYPVPSHRPSGDIDIWQFGKQIDADKKLQREKGVKIDYSHHHHSVFTIDGVMIENHYDFLNTHSHKSNKELEKMLKPLAYKEGKIIEIDKQKIYLPPVDFNALFLLRHTGAHFAAEEITLRHLTDWAMFVKSYHQEINWEWLEHVAKEQNMYKFLHCLNALCIDYIGLPETMFPIVFRDKKIENKVMTDILHPQFADKKGIYTKSMTRYIYRIKRWWGQRWKHKLIFKEGDFKTFFVLLQSHFTKPQGYEMEIVK